MNEVAVIKTSRGEMAIEFWPDVGAENGRKLQDAGARGFYDGTAFHRIVKGFMIQGG